MEIIKLSFIICIGITLGDSSDLQTLVRVERTSPLTLPEIWNQTGKAWNIDGISKRSSLIDQWYYRMPQLIVLVVKDIYDQELARLRYTTDGSSNNLTDILKSSKISDGVPFQQRWWYGFGYNILVENGTLIFSGLYNNTMNTKAYLIHGRLNSSTTDQVTCFSRGQHAIFSIDQALNKLHNDKTILLSQAFEEPDGFQSLKFNYTYYQIASRYITGFSLYSEDNLQVEFDVQYTSVRNYCDTEDDQRLIYLMTTSPYVCNGSYYDIDVIRAECLIITFSQTVYKVKVKLLTVAENYICQNNIQLQAIYDEDPTTEAATFHSTEEVYTTMTETCYCQCDKLKSTNLTVAEIEQMIEQIKRELTVEKNTLSSAVRKKTSASDTRTSAQNVGFVGAILIAVEICFLVSLDILRLCHFLRNL